MSKSFLFKGVQPPLITPILQEVIEKELNKLSDEPTLLYRAVVRWREKRGRLTDATWEDPRMCSSKCEYTTRATILLIQNIINAFTNALINGEEKEDSIIEVEDNNKWISYAIDITELENRIKKLGTRLYSLNFWGTSSSDQFNYDKDGMRLYSGGFPGHTFCILQTVSETGASSFKVIQSYYGEYNLKNFLENDGKEVLNQEQLNSLIEAFIIISSTKKWGDDTIKAWKKISGVDTNHWKGAIFQNLDHSIQCIELPAVTKEAKLKINTLENVHRDLEQFKEESKPIPPDRTFSDLSGPL